MQSLSLSQKIGVILSSIAIIVLDQYTKHLAFAWVSLEEGSKTITPFLNIVRVWNFGISFGLLQSPEKGALLFSGLAVAVSALLLRWLWKESSLISAYALGLIIAGAIGNAIDRLRLGAVADFMDFHWNEYHWPAFNVADSAICIGVLMLLALEWLAPKTKA